MAGSTEGTAVSEPRPGTRWVTVAAEALKTTTDRPRRPARASSIMVMHARGLGRPGQRERHRLLHLGRRCARPNTGDGRADPQQLLRTGPRPASIAAQSGTSAGSASSGWAYGHLSSLSARRRQARGRTRCPRAQSQRIALNQSPESYELRSSDFERSRSEPRGDEPGALPEHRRAPARAPASGPGRRPRCPAAACTPARRTGSRCRARRRR